MPVSCLSCCSHLAYHQYKGLLVPVISGKDEAWREAPEDLPLGRSISN